MDDENKNGIEGGAEPDRAAKPEDAPPGEGRGPRRGRAMAFAAAGIVCVLAVGGIGAMWALGSAPPVQEMAQAGAQEEADPLPSEVSFRLAAEGAGANSTKAKVTVQDADGKTVAEDVEVAPNEDASLGELEAGGYSLHVTLAPVNADGSTYRLPDQAVSFEIEGKGDPVGVECALGKIEVADMTKEQLEAAASVLGDAGNAQAAATANTAAASAPSVAGSAGSVQQPAPSGMPTGGGASPGSSSASGGEDHEHSWVAQTRQQWISNMVWIEDSAAWDEAIYSTVGVYVVSDGTRCYSQDELNAYLQAAGRGSGLSYTADTETVQTGSVHHDATGHYEDRGHYETVTTGYVCSVCGATK